MKYCHDCKHSKRPHGYANYEWLCTHEKNLNPVTGTGYTAGINRLSEYGCGMGARYFEDKPPHKSLLRRFIDKFS